MTKLAAPVKNKAKKWMAACSARVKWRSQQQVAYTGGG